MIKGLDNEKPDYDPDTCDFCYYPFFEVLVTADGHYKPCSKHGDFITHEGRIMEVGKDSIKDAWHSDYMQTMRHNFKNNIRTSGCGECWREQAMGLKPMRYDSYNYGIPRHQVDNPEEPMRVEINADNICNLKCRICSMYASSKWIQETKDVYGKDGKIHINMTEENLDIVKSWVPNLIEIGLFGGEPLLAKPNLELMRYCVESGHAKNLALLFNTNTTVYSDEIAELLKGFRKVMINFSIDDIGPRFEYQRKGANWDEAVANMRKFIALGGYSQEDAIECKINCAVNTMNIYYFPEYFEFMNKEFPGLPVHWNLIYEPWALSVQILPKEIKQVIADRLKQFVKATYEMSESRTKTVENLVTYLEGEDEPDRDFSNFFTTIARHDTYRNESYAATFPEFWAHIEKYCPAHLDMKPVPADA